MKVSENEKSKITCNGMLAFSATALNKLAVTAVVAYLWFALNFITGP